MRHHRCGESREEYLEVHGLRKYYGVRPGQDPICLQAVSAGAGVDEHLESYSTGV